MKSRISLLVAILFIASTLFVFAQDAKDLSVSGTLTAFNETSLSVTTVDAKGKPKVLTFALDATAVVKRVDQVSEWMSVARKGLTVTVSYVGKNATAVQVPFYGLEAQGQAVKTDDPKFIGLQDVRINRTDSSLVAVSERKDAAGRIVAKVEFKEVAAEDDSAWSLADAKTVMLGNLNILPDSVKLTYNGAAVKVLPGVDGKGVFEGAAGTSAVLDLTKGIYKLLFDVELGADFSAASKVITLSFKKKMYEQTTTEITYLEVDPTACIELNGKIAALEDAMSMSNFWLIRCNTDNKIVHVDASYRNFETVVKSVNAKAVSLAFGKKTVKLNASEGITMSLASGAPATVKDFKAGSTVLVTTEPADAYNVVLIALK